MRFELFLIELPKAPQAKVQAALAELPKGASTGTVLKAMEARQVPTVSFAWSDDKRVLNEVMDTLVDLGASVKLVDHGSLVEKFVTFVAEKVGRARYLDDDDDPDSRKYIKLNHGKKQESLSEAIMRHALTYFLQLCATGVLFVWFVALRVGLERVFTIPELMPQFLACALGLLVSYTCTSSVRAVQAGRLTRLRALPQLIVGVVLTVASFFFLGPSAEKQVVEPGKVKRPPSMPYSGLISELQRRKLGKEAMGRDGEESGDAADLAAAEAAEAEAEGLWCEKPEPVEAPACEGGPAWEDALACLPEALPQKPASKPRVIKKREAIARSEQPEAPAEEILEAPPAEQVWGVTMGLSTVLTLSAMWLLSLLGLFLQLRPRLGVREREAGPESVVNTKPTEANAKPTEANAKPTEDEDVFAALEADLPQAPSMPAPAEQAQLAALAAERDALQGELSDAKTMIEKLVAETKANPIADNPQIANLQRDVGLARGALGANQVAIADLKRELALKEERETAFQAQLVQMQEELAHVTEQRDSVRHALLEMRARKLDTRRADNDGGERNTGLTRQLPDEADESSYSVQQVQEERVSLGKRRRP